MKRDAETVLRDVVNGVVSIKAARRDYGICIDPATMAIVVKQTRILRSSL